MPTFSFLLHCNRGSSFYIFARSPTIQPIESRDHGGGAATPLARASEVSRVQAPQAAPYNGDWFFGRPTGEELRLNLRAALQRCRPYWDISSARQRAAWARAASCEAVNLDADGQGDL